MTEIRALIADDEALSRRVVQQLLERYSDVVIVGECADGAAARESIARLRPDVVFLDIRMPLESGLDVARRREPLTGPLIVFISAFSSFALPAFDTAALDYLTKPLTEERFDIALGRVRERLHTRRLAAGASPPEPRPEYRTHLVSRAGSRDIIVPVETIDYIEADDVYAVVYGAGRPHLVRAALDTLEASLDPVLFTRVHRSYIVRLDSVREVRRRGRAELLLDGGAVIPVSRRRRRRLDTLLT